MNESNNKPVQRKERERLNLPFRQRKFDLGRWVYAHHKALLATVILYLVLAISFVTVRIVLEKQQHDSEIYYFDPEEFERLQEELERAQELNRMLNEMQEPQGPVQNRVSNENAADTGEEFRNDKGLDAREIFDRAEAAQQAMRDNRSRQQRGEQEIQDMIDNHNRGGSEDDGKEPSSSRVEGNVMVSYSLSAPVRNAVYLYKPAYKCQGGGTVVVEITVNRNGDVTAATVKSATRDDYCMTTTAVDAALQSRFNIDSSAPEKQVGTIIYQFVAQ